MPECQNAIGKQEHSQGRRGVRSISLACFAPTGIDRRAGFPIPLAWSASRTGKGLSEQSMPTSSGSTGKLRPLSNTTKRAKGSPSAGFRWTWYRAYSLFSKVAVRSVAASLPARPTPTIATRHSPLEGCSALDAIASWGTQKTISRHLRQQSNTSRNHQQPRFNVPRSTI